MNHSALLAFCFALPLAALAQTKPTATSAKPATQQVTEVTEDLDPATGKVIRRTTRTTTVPAGTPLPGATPTSATSTSAPSTTADDAPVTAASDATVSDFFREKTVVSRLTAPELLDAYNRFMDKVRSDRRGWNSTAWYNAATVLSSLNARYNQIHDAYSLDDKLTIRSEQAEFQTLRTTRQITDQLSDKL